VELLASLLKVTVDSHVKELEERYRTKSSKNVETIANLSRPRSFTLQYTLVSDPI